VSRETLQQHKLLKVIKKKLVRKVSFTCGHHSDLLVVVVKALDMFKKMDDETYENFWKEFSTKLAPNLLCYVIVRRQGGRVYKI